MNIEYEATFPNINKKEIRQKLKKAGAKLVRPEFLQKRVSFDLPKGFDHAGHWVRVRDEGDKITMSYKMASSSDKGKIEEQKEVCLEIDDFDRGVELLKSIKCHQKGYQETKRELWTLGNVEICIDTWPYLEPFLEVEGKTEQAVKQISQKLGLDYTQAKFCAIGQLYKEKYGWSLDKINNNTPRITFSDPNPFLK